MKEYIFEGKIHLITDNHGELIPDIDTDQIFHNAHLHITDIEEMGQYTFGNLEGWKDFSQMVKPGDMVIAGRNFGAGSSRQQAVDCFKSLGVTLIIAESFGAIYKRNAINSGFPIMVARDIRETVLEKKIEHGQGVKIDLLSGKLENLHTGAVVSPTPFSKVQRDIYDKGTLLKI